MLRIVRLSALAAVVAAVWIYLCLAETSDAKHRLILLAPIICGVAFGAYLLLLLIVGVSQFRDCPEDADALKKEIAVAKKELTAKGILSA